eukprot:m51a1_g10065 putative traf3-interacting protein 1 (560) ;mRNA; r:90635-92748
MGDLEESSPVVAETIKAISALIPKPKLTPKLVARPPFKLLYEIIMNISSAKGFPAPDTFSDAEKSLETLSEDKKAKGAFLKKVIDAVGAALGEKIECEPPKVLAGKNADKTNQFLQALARAAVAPKKPAAKRNKSADAPKGTTVPAAGDGEAPKKKKVTKKAAAAAAAAAEAAPAAEAPAPEAAAEAPAPAAAEDQKPKRRKKKAAAAEGDAGAAEGAAAADAQPEAPPPAAQEAAPPKKEENAASMLDQFQEAPKPAESTAPSLAPAPAPAPAPEQAPAAGRAPSGRKAAKAADKDAEEPQSEQASALVQAAAAAAMAAAAAPKPSVGVTGMQPKKKTDEKTLVAARPPPRIQGAMRAVNSTLNKSDNVPKVALLSEKDQQDDEDEVVIVTDAPLEASMTDDTLPDVKQGGAVVNEIVEAMKEFGKDGAQAAAPSKKVRTATEMKREKVEKDIAKLRESVQSICQSAHPVSKALDYYQEDLDSMEKELKMWTGDAASFLRALEDEENATKASLQPYIAQLQQQDQLIREQEDKIMAVKAAISENARKIEQMLSLVVKG